MALLRKKSTAADRVADIAAKLDAARANLGQMEAAKAAAAAAAETALAALDAAALAAARRATEVAEADHKDAVAIFDAASAALDQAEAEAAAERWEGEASRYRAAVAAAEKSTRADLEEVRRLVHGLLRRNAHLAAHHRALEFDRPATAAPLPGPEAWRSIAGIAEEIVAERIAEEWVDEAGRPLSAEKSKLVRSLPNGTGEYAHVYDAGGFTRAHTTVAVVRKRVRRRQIRERVPSEIATPLAESLQIPGVTAVDRPVWRPTAAESVLSALDALETPRPPRERATREEVVVLPD